MIAKLKGIVDELKPTEVIMDINGVGYLVSIPFTTFSKLQNKKEAELFVHTIHKEDQFRLFGFTSESEKQIFIMLLSISGIGPAMALSIISSINIDLLMEAVRRQEAALLTAIPGIGKAKADKLVFELKRKIKKLEQYASPDSSGSRASSVKNDAIEALVSLGFDEIKALNAVENILTKFPDIPLEELIKHALKKISE